MGTHGSRTRTALRALTLACLCLGLCACAGVGKKDDKDPARLEQLADEAANQGKIQAALPLYVAALEHGAKKQGVRLKMARIFFNQADYARAAEAFEEVLAAQPGDPEALWGTGYSYFSLGQTEAAQARLTDLAAARPDMAQAHHLLGVLANLARQPAKALPELERARQLDPTDPDIANNLGLAQFMAGRYAEAAGSFRFSLRAKPSARTSNNLGLALCRQGRFDEAFEAFKTGAGEAAAFNNTGVCLEEAGKREAALEFYERAVTASPRYFAQADENAARLRAALGGLGESQATGQASTGQAGQAAQTPAGQAAQPPPQAAGRTDRHASSESILGTPVPVDGPPQGVRTLADPAPRTAREPAPQAPREAKPRQPVPFEPAPTTAPATAPTTAATTSPATPAPSAVSSPATTSPATTSPATTSPATAPAPSAASSPMTPAPVASPAAPDAAKPTRSPEPAAVSPPRLPQPLGETPQPSAGPFQAKEQDQDQAQVRGSLRKRAQVTSLEQETAPAGQVVRLRTQGPAPQASIFFHGAPATLIVDIQADPGLRLPQSLPLPGPVATTATLSRGERGLRLSVSLAVDGPAMPVVELEQLPGETKILIKTP